MKYHKAADIFPLLEGEDYEAFKRDILLNGLREPIVTYKGEIIDGRNRDRVCEECPGVKRKTVEWDGHGSLVAFVVSVNLHRRQLKPGQKALSAAKAREAYDKEAKERMKAGGGDKKSGPVNLPDPIEDQGDARDKAGQAFGVSGKTVDHATKVLTQGVLALVEAVQTGKLAVSTAARTAELPKPRQRQVARLAVAGKKRNAKEVLQEAQVQGAQKRCSDDRVISGHSFDKLLECAEALARLAAEPYLETCLYQMKTKIKDLQGIVAGMLK